MNPVLVSMFGNDPAPRCGRLSPYANRPTPQRARPYHGPAVNLSDPEMGVAFTTVISAIGAGVAAAAKGIGSAVSKGKAAKAARKAEAQRIADMRQAALAKQKRTTSLIIVGSLVAVGAGAILLSKG